MSGGTFNYVCFSAESASEIFSKLDDLKALEQYCRELNNHDAADEILPYIEWLETIQRRVAVKGKRLANLLRAVEWVASGDSSPGAIDIALEQLEE